jgi:hypothetical protein
LYADCIKLNKFSDIKDCGLFWFENKK